MKKILIISIILLTFLIIFNGCKSENNQINISKAIGVDVSTGSEISNYDVHGFFGDGTTCIKLSFSDNTCLNQIKENLSWHALPLSDNLFTLIYGTDDRENSVGPYIIDSNSNPLVPKIENGYYYFTDRHSESSNNQDDTDLLKRSSINCTVAIYDMDTNMLYYCTLDT